MPNNDVHPDLRRIARIAPRRMVGARTLPVMRAVSGLTERLRGRGPAEDVEAITLSSGVGIRLFRPVGAAEPAPALLWIHGGGYVIGTAAQDDRLCRRFSRRLGIAVASVDYRLAPDHPYPAPLEDCYAALTWLAGLPWVDAGRVAIAGASAGGGLAAALALLARDRGETDPAFQLLAYPMLDDRSSARPENPRYRLWDTRSNHFGWTAYLGGADPRVAVPGRREDLGGLPPAWIGVGTHDLFHDESVDYARRLEGAGVPCGLEVVDGAFHGFDLVVPKAAVSQRFFGRQCEVLRSALAPAG
ncbi:esterase [Mycobacterium saskatchewanense]|uniref:Alpha/beta hydrolase n=1 Tax=Mycobacterium saskatchewanense TaxID=220927 RepID=A0AAJ3NKW2_9MYCO|nr:alpha/beta hydrolase [Mycobacterium saskatchewanense]ORW65166.1 alpha/beta hydrolase [Mycobacterium saskatchewanense]BBX64611.1 esterase [Mycobacterium saskatchewanense]